MAAKFGRLSSRSLRRRHLMKPMAPMESRSAPRDNSFLTRRRFAAGSVSSMPGSHSRASDFIELKSRSGLPSKGPKAGGCVGFAKGWRWHVVDGANGARCDAAPVQGRRCVPQAVDAAAACSVGRSVHWRREAIGGGLTVLSAVLVF
jgi:hypothetical protein